jgi:hypothetical protein
MAGKQNSEIPSRLARAAARFAAWRRAHDPHTRIPKFLWTAAVRLAAEFGISRSATRLRLNYYDLKKHVDATAAPSKCPSVVSFRQACMSLFRRSASVAVLVYWRAAMGGKQSSEVHPRLVRAAVRFAAWRRTHEPHTRIPKPLWTTAVRLAAEFGISRTATCLRLNYYDLKKHVDATGVASDRRSVARQISAPWKHPSAARHTRSPWKPPSAARQVPSFVELPASAFPTAGECVIELENTSGCRMRIQINRSHCPDLVALSSAFCRIEP